MTKLEKITRSRLWRGSKIEEAILNGRPAYRLTHPRGAVAYVYKDAAGVQERHWEAYKVVRDRQRAAVIPAWGKGKETYRQLRQEELARAVAHYKRLSGIDLGGGQ